jgi:tRNA pseudouridine55 synthase
MFLLIDKPKGITSHDVIDEVRKISGEKRVGHAGTLDPIATGLLMVGVGRESTKKLGKLTTDTNKTYVADISLGEERDTDDVSGKIRNSKHEINQSMQLPNRNKSLITDIKLQSTLNSFVGKQKQIPPKYSAIKIKGKKAYELARKGIDIKLETRDVVIHSIKLMTFEYPKLRIETSVSSGTYIRSLARDIGRKLGTGAYIDNLRRTRIGSYDVRDSIELGKLNKDNWSMYALELSI